MRDSLLLALAVLAVFGLSLTDTFHFDDYALFSDSAITSNSGWLDVWRPWQTQPLTWFTFWLNHRVGGREPAGYHAVNLLLHLAAVLILWDLLPRIIPRRAALIASIVFALHPLVSEPVLNVFARGTLLATLLCLMSLRSWVAGRRWIAVLWFGLSLLAKEECVSFPIFLLLLHFSISWNAAEFRQIATMLGLSLAAGLRVLFATVIEPGLGAGPQAGVPASAYLAAQGVVILRYFRLLVFPWGFTAGPDIKVPSVWVAAGAWLVVLAVAIVAAMRLSRAREGFWFLGGLVLLLPSSSIFPAADLAADRRMYLPMIAFAAVAGLALRTVRTRYVLVVAALLGLLSFGRAKVWRDDRSLWLEAVRSSPARCRQVTRLLADHRGTAGGNHQHPPAGAKIFVIEIDTDDRVGAHLPRLFGHLVQSDFLRLPQFSFVCSRTAAYDVADAGKKILENVGAQNGFAAHQSKVLHNLFSFDAVRRHQ